MNEKMVWAILDIEPTDDVDAIREAYRAKLVHTNPEDDQEGFMALKDAYDEAMRLAEAGNEEEAEELSPIMMKVDELYKDITKRQDIKEWDALLSAPEFSSIDEQDIIRNEILTYTLDNYKYSTEVWRKLDSVLTIVQDADILRDQYPQGYIDFIVECILYGNYVLEDKVIAGRKNGVSEINNFAIDSDQTPLEIPEFKCEVDEYVDLLSRIGREYGNIDNVKVSEENRLALIDRLGADILFARRYDYYHPFEEIAVIKYLYYKERYEECFKLLESAMDLFVPLVVASIINDGIAGGSRGLIFRNFLILIALAILGMVFSFTAQWMAAKASTGFAADLRQALFDHVQKLSYRELDSLGTDTLITRMTSDVNQIQNGLNLALRLLLRSPFIVFGAMIMAFTIDFRCACIFAGAIPMLGIAVFAIMLLSIPLFAKVQEALDRLLGLTRENLTGVRVIRAFCKEQQEIDEFDRRNALVTRMNEGALELEDGI